MTVIKGFKCAGIILSPFASFAAAIITGLIVMGIGSFIISRMSVTEKVLQDDRFALVEKMFSVLMAFTACAMVFAHGSNDVAIAVGPMKRL